MKLLATTVCSHRSQCNDVIKAIPPTRQSGFESRFNKTKQFRWRWGMLDPTPSPSSNCPGSSSSSQVCDKALFVATLVRKWADGALEKFSLPSPPKKILPEPPSFLLCPTFQMSLGWCWLPVECLHLSTFSLSQVFLWSVSFSEIIFLSYSHTL